MKLSAINHFIFAARYYEVRFGYCRPPYRPTKYFGVIRDDKHLKYFQLHLWRFTLSMDRY